MLLTVLVPVLVLPREFVLGILDTLKPVATLSTPAEMEAWRKKELQKKANEMAPFKSQHDLAKTGGWGENEKVLSGQSQELPFDSPQYMNLLVWLHLDPPNNEEVRLRVCKLLLDRVKENAITLWEMLTYPGSANAAEIKIAAHNVLADAAYQWSDDEKKRLGAIAGSIPASKSVTAGGTKK